MLFLSHQTQADLINAPSCSAVPVILSYSGGHFSQMRAETATQLGLAVLAASCFSLLDCQSPPPPPPRTVCLSWHVTGAGCSPDWTLSLEHTKCKHISCIYTRWLWLLFVCLHKWSYLFGELKNENCHFEVGVWEEEQLFQNNSDQRNFQKYHHCLFVHIQF